MMKTRDIAVALAIVAAAACPGAAVEPGRFEAGKGQFTLDGKPFTVKAAELHYPRIPRPYWEQRIQMCKALGMNTICLYVFWNAHESEPGKFDFTGQNDLREFVKLCQKNGMKVILRPGPYVCAEWEMGGLPWWLLKDKDIRLREGDPRFLQAVDRFEKEVAAQVGDLTVDKGGPILMVQVENEYGSYGTDKPYVSAIRDMLRKHWGKQTVMFQCDWASNFLNNGLDDLIWTMNFGTGTDIDSQFAELRKARPDSPLMCSEYWSGWFDKWGANHETRPAEAMTAGIDEMLSKGISFSLYMTHGGTNWGHWAGANSPGYAPDVTSYDYDAPINEAGRPTPKYYMLRDVLSRYAEEELPGVPDTIPSASIPAFALTEAAPLMQNMPDAIVTDRPLPMEELGQGFGSALYRTLIPEEGADSLITEGVHDFAIVSVNRRKAGTIDRRIGQTSLALPATQKGDTLDIFVEATGRINFGRAIKDYKGLTGDVTLSKGGRRIAPQQWETYLYPDDKALFDTYGYMPVTGPDYPAGVYRGTFIVPEEAAGADTFLDFSTWGKGLVYVNGHALGRIWNIGPQQTLYTPGCWLKPGENEITVLDVLGPRKPRVQGLAAPILDRVTAGSEDTELDGVPQDAVMAAEYILKYGNGWSELELPEGAKGRYLYIEILSGNSLEESSVAEIHLRDGKGERVGREQWKSLGSDSSNTAENHGVTKAFDQQESTYWESAPGHGYPHLIAVDLGTVTDASAVELLPRTESGAPGSPTHVRIYLR